MNDGLHSYSQRSDGPTVDALALKLTGDTSLETDLKRTQEVEVTVRGIVIGHIFEDKRDKNGDIVQTIKAAKIKVDELVEIVVLTVPRRMRGQTAFPMDGEAHEDDAPVGTAVAVLAGEDGDPDDVPEAIVIAGELEAGARPEGVDANGELSPPMPGEGPVDNEEPEPAAATVIDRHPQVPEKAWGELNHEQRLDVAERVDKIVARQQAIDAAGNATDRQAITRHLEDAVSWLLDDYGIELLPAAAIEDADADVPADEPPPPPVSADSAPVPSAELQRRRRYLMAKVGLPAEMEDARQEELAEIDRRLKGRGLKPVPS